LHFQIIALNFGFVSHLKFFFLFVNVEVDVVAPWKELLKSGRFGPVHFYTLFVGYACFVFIMHTHTHTHTHTQITCRLMHIARYQKELLEMKSFWLIRAAYRGRGHRDPAENPGKSDLVHL
jgi:hypothetical protein